MPTTTMLCRRLLPAAVIRNPIQLLPTARDLRSRSLTNDDSDEQPAAMSAYPAYVIGTLCIVGGITGYARTRSVPSIVAGVGVGLLYLWSADSIRKGTPNGLNAALAASAILFLSSAPRAAKGPVPATLTAASALVGAYYGKTVYDLRS